MSMVTKKPPYKQSVGAQYICFTSPGSDPSVFQPSYEEEVEKTKTVKTVSVTENSESTPVYASGDIYDTNENVSGTEISVESIAFDATTKARARGDTVTSKGFVKKGSAKKGKPFFAYGKVVELTGGNQIFEWYPKCKLVTVTDETKTKEASFSEQNDTITISAMPYNEDGDICFSYDSSMKKIDNLTEERFFSKPVLEDADIEIQEPILQEQEGKSSSTKASGTKQ